MTRILNITEDTTIRALYTLREGEVNQTAFNSFAIGVSMHGYDFRSAANDPSWWAAFDDTGFDFVLSYVYTVDTLIQHGDFRAFNEMLPHFITAAQRFAGTDKFLIVTVDAGEGYTNRYFAALGSFLDALVPYSSNVIVAPYYAEWFNYATNYPNGVNGGGQTTDPRGCEDSL